MIQQALQTTAADEQKAALRASALKARSELAEEGRIAAGLAVAAEGTALVARRRPKRVSLFFSVRGEIDTLPLARRLAEQGVALCLPVIVKKAAPLVFRDWRPGDPLVDRPFGLKEPPADAAEVTPDFVFVPLAAFDAAGGRLGYGGGFYDRTLEQLRAKQRVVAVGLAFAAQEVEAVPTLDHDAPLDGMLTELGFRPTAGAEI